MSSRNGSYSDRLSEPFGRSAEVAVPRTRRDRWDSRRRFGVERKEKLSAIPGQSSRFSRPPPSSRSPDRRIGVANFKALAP